MPKHKPSFADSDVGTLAITAALLTAFALLSFWYDSRPTLPPLPEKAPVHRPVGR